MRADIAANQRRTARELLGRLRPYWRTEAGLPARIAYALRTDHRFGRRDRRLYRELIYVALRHLSWIEPWLGAAPDFADEALAWLAPETAETAGYRRAVAGAWPACPPAAADQARLLGEIAAERLGIAPTLPSLLPTWCEDECPAALEPEQYAALNRRAPLWVRLQADDPAAALAEFDRRGWRWQRSAPLPTAVRVDTEADLTTSAAYRDGAIEIQDLGSQLVLASLAPAPNGHWLDACAGAGGKTLQLAILLGPGGRVDAHDVRPSALAALAERARRARLDGRVQSVERPALAAYDGVLVDAPCSGSGTWRRSPHLKWVTQPAAIASAAAYQLSLLAQFAVSVRPGGRLVYATCSLCTRENERVVRRFMEAHPAFQPEPPAAAFSGRPAGTGTVFLPAAHDGDGFFVASFRRAN